ncbi:MAG: STAS domain-containing protein [Actinomycetota bacterium]|nr:STAS domain-containing protein [Actinomycetota bacterium]
MTEGTISMDVRHVTDKTSVIDIKGDITGSCEEALMAAYTDASESSTKAIVLNFTDLQYMNSTGIGLLVTLLVRAQRQKQRILAFGLTDHYRQIFELTRLDEAVAIHGSEQEAMAAAGA